MDYNKYRCNGRETLWIIGVSAGVTGILSWLFYQSWYAMGLFLPVCLLYWKKYKKEKILQRKERLLMEFRDGMQAVSAALLAGYSMENAWREAEKAL